MPLAEETVLANQFVPQQQRHVIERNVNVVVPSLSLQQTGPFQERVRVVREALLPFHQCMCENRDQKYQHPHSHPQLRSIESDMYFAVQRSYILRNGGIVDEDKDGRNRLSGVSGLKDYHETFEKLLVLERRERLMLFERYTHYDQTVRVAKRGGSATWFVNGLKDARPAVQVGDLVLLRPVVSSSGYHADGIELQCQVTDFSSPTKVAISWLEPREWQQLKHTIPCKFAIRVVPHPKEMIRCLSALDWLKRTTTMSNDFQMEVQQLLFPTLAPLLPRPSPDQTHALDNMLIADLNDQQSQFVRLVLRRTMQPEYKTVRPPVLLTGPAGTGKTKTLLYAVQKVLELNKYSSNSGISEHSSPVDRNRILLCAPSHTAANVLTQRLTKVLTPARLFRLLDYDREVSSIPLSILSFCHQDNYTGRFSIPDAAQLLKYDVIVCTCSDASILYSAGLTNQQLSSRRRCFKQYLQTTSMLANLHADVEGVDTPHFTHLFVDEAAQATEPETLIPLSVVVDSTIESRKVETILVGDPKQLCPLVHCAAAVRGGLDVPWIERLLLRPLTCLGGGDPSLLGPRRKTEQDQAELRGIDTLSVFLMENYRGHPSFLMLVGSLFYSDKLFPNPRNAPREEYWCNICNYIDSIAKPFMLPASIDLPPALQSCKQTKWPMRFIGVHGKDTSVSVAKSYTGESWANQKEADMVTRVVQAISVDGKVPTQSIGVMSPFRGQVISVRNLLRSRNLGGVDVGTVSDFQAKEKSVIVLSVTRSTSQFIANDMSQRIGLFGSEKQTNVALTRAENMLVVIGDPNAMMKDDVWSQCLLFFLRNGLWRGDGSEAAAERIQNGRVVRLRPGHHEDDVNYKAVVVGSQEHSLRCGQ